MLNHPTETPTKNMPGKRKESPIFKAIQQLLVLGVSSCLFKKQDTFGGVPGGLFRVPGAQFRCPRFTDGGWTRRYRPCLVAPETVIHKTHDADAEMKADPTETYGDLEKPKRI